jgi:hypothetical protein
VRVAEACPSCCWTIFTPAPDDDGYPTGDHGVQTNSNRRLGNVRRCTGDPVADVREVEHPDASRTTPITMLRMRTPEVPVNSRIDTRTIASPTPRVIFPSPLVPANANRAEDGCDHGPRQERADQDKAATNQHYDRNRLCLGRPPAARRDHDAEAAEVGVSPWRRDCAPRTPLPVERFGCRLARRAARAPGAPNVRGRRRDRSPMDVEAAAPDWLKRGPVTAEVSTRAPSDSKGYSA